jgi:hypothetical protein
MPIIPNEKYNPLVEFLLCQLTIITTTLTKKVRNKMMEMGVRVNIFPERSLLSLFYNKTALLITSQNKTRPRFLGDAFLNLTLESLSL